MQDDAGYRIADVVGFQKKKVAEKKVAEKKAVAPITVDIDDTSFASAGSHRGHGMVMILTDAIVWTEETPATRMMVLASSTAARMISARMNQDMMPFRANASWDGTCWNIENLLPDTKVA